MAAFLVSFVAVMAILGTDGHVPISLGTPGLVNNGFYFLNIRLIQNETLHAHLSSVGRVGSFLCFSDRFIVRKLFDKLH